MPQEGPQRQQCPPQYMSREAPYARICCSNQRRLQQSPGKGATSQETVCAACCSTQQTPRLRACNTTTPACSIAIPCMVRIRAKSGQQPGSRLHCARLQQTHHRLSGCLPRWPRCRGASSQLLLLLQAHRVALEAQGTTPDSPA